MVRHGVHVCRVAPAETGRSGAALGGVLRIRSISRRPTVPSAVPFARLPTRLTGTSDNYLPAVAGLAGCLGLVLAAGRHHVIPCVQTLSGSAEI